MIHLGKAVTKRPARADHLIEHVVVSGVAVDVQDRVVLRRIQLAVRDVRHPEVLDDLAAFELQVAELRHLVLRLAGPVGMGRRARCRQRDEQRDTEAENGFHRSAPVVAEIDPYVSPLLARAQNPGAWR